VCYHDRIPFESKKISELRGLEDLGVLERQLEVIFCILLKIDYTMTGLFFSGKQILPQFVIFCNVSDAAEILCHASALVR